MGLRSSTTFPPSGITPFAPSALTVVPVPANTSDRLKTNIVTHETAYLRAFGSTELSARVASSRCFIAMNESSCSSSDMVRILSSRPSASRRFEMLFVFGRNFAKYKIGVKTTVIPATAPMTIHMALNPKYQATNAASPAAKRAAVAEIIRDFSAPSLASLL